MGAVRPDLHSILVPPRCVACHRPTAPRAMTCAPCGRELAEPRRVELDPGALDSVAAAFPLSGAPRGLVNAIKHRRLLAPAAVAGAAVAAVAPAGSLEGVVPVPPGALRRARRGFDPAALIAAEAADRLGVPLLNPLRRLDRSSQRRKDRRRRRADPPRFTVRSAAPHAVLLIDDVITTGATVAAAGRALREAGAVVVHAGAFAATPGHRDPSATAATDA